MLNAPNKVHFGIDVKRIKSKDNLGSWDLNPSSSCEYPSIVLKKL
jgi:hypothetical protein